MDSDELLVLQLIAELEEGSASAPEAKQVAGQLQMDVQDVEDIIDELGTKQLVQPLKDMHGSAACMTPAGRRLLKKTSETFTTPKVSGVGNRTVFVVHGRNSQARTAMFEFLRSIGLHPLEWAQVVKATGKASPYVGEVVKTGFSLAQAVVVLFTPDDEAQLRSEFREDGDDEFEAILTGQPRQNVLLEAGMALGIDEDRTVIVEIGKLRPISDLSGRHTIRMNNSPQRRNELLDRLESAGCSSNRSGTDWLSAGNFDADVLVNGGRSKPTNVDSSDDSRPELGDRDIAILRILVDHHGRIMWSDLLQESMLNPIEAEHVVDRLESIKFISKTHVLSADGGTRLNLSQVGASTSFIAAC